METRNRPLNFFVLLRPCDKLREMMYYPRIRICETNFRKCYTSPRTANISTDISVTTYLRVTKWRYLIRFATFLN